MKMYYISNEEFIEVYQIFNNFTALIFSPIERFKNESQDGWKIVPMKDLIPEEYASEFINKINTHVDDVIPSHLIPTLDERLNKNDYHYYICSDKMSYSNQDLARIHEFHLYQQEGKED